MTALVSFLKFVYYYRAGRNGIGIPYRFHFLLSSYLVSILSTFRKGFDTFKFACKNYYLINFNLFILYNRGNEDNTNKLYTT